MHIGAHPDDEDSGLLAYLARGENARTAYLSLTRGDGGQNIIGSELFESLGVIRTEELLQAQKIRRRGAVFYARIRFRFFENSGGSKGKMGRENYFVRRGSRHSHISPASRHFAFFRHDGRRSRTASICRLHRASRRQSRRRSNAMHGRGRAVAGFEILRFARFSFDRRSRL